MKNKLIKSSTDNFITITPDKLSPIQRETSNNLNAISSLFQNTKPSSLKIPIAILKDPSDNSINTIAHQYTNIPEQFCMIYPITQILFLKQNKIFLNDLFIFFFICDNYAKENAFFINSSFWSKINTALLNCNIKTSKRSIQRSLNKLSKLAILIHLNKAEYTVNKILIYSGSIKNRHNDIISQNLAKAINSSSL